MYIDNSVILKYGINGSKTINGIYIDNIIGIKKIITKGLSYKHQKMISEEVGIMKHIRDNPHDNIVACYDVIDDLDTIYIIMEYCDGGDMSKLIGKPMKEENVKYYFSQLVNGIKYLDEHKIIHRDFKPKNLLLTCDKKILKICDFGLAKNKTGLSKINTVCGSPLYMAPEMFKNKGYDDSIDIWSIGIIMYEMIYGNNPLSKIKDYQELEYFMTNNSKFIDIPPNKHMSNECIDLLKTLLVKDSCKRITLKELYTHKWLFDNPNVHLLDTHSDENLYDNTRDYGNIECDSSNIFLFNLEE